MCFNTALTRVGGSLSVGSNLVKAHAHWIIAVIQGVRLVSRATQKLRDPTLQRLAANMPARLVGP